MEIAIMLLALPLFLFNGFALDSLGGDEAGAEEAEHGTDPDSDLPPIL